MATSASFLGFKVNFRHPYSIMAKVEETNTDTSAIAISTAGTDAMAMRWSFRLMPETIFGSKNLGGVLFAHRLQYRRGAFIWPGNALQLLGHKTDVADKTIVNKVDKGMDTIRVVNGNDLLVGRLVQLPGINRVHVITAITPENPRVGTRGATDLTLEPPLRGDVPAQSKLKCKPVPVVKHDPNGGTYGINYVERMMSNLIVLVEA